MTRRCADHHLFWQEMNSEKRHQIEWFTGLAFFIAFIAAHFMFGIKAAVKVLGVACIATGLLWMCRRSVPVGTEGREPSFYLNGWGAMLAGFLILVVGVMLLIYSGMAVCLLGWGGGTEC